VGPWGVCEDADWNGDQVVLALECVEHCRAAVRAEAVSALFAFVRVA
jgi:hypothetical protein